MARRKKAVEEKYDTNKMIEQSHAEVETTGPETTNGVIASSSLVNVRNKPSFYNSEVVEVLRAGDVVIVLGVEENFYKVNTSVNKGVYIHRNYVELKGV